MEVNKTTGLIQSARQVVSPNCDDRPEVCPIDLIVIHNISLPPRQFGGGHIEALFTNTLNPDEHPFFQEIYQHKVSAHLLIRRDGELVQFVPFHKRAWHAGVSEFKGRSACNDFSIGIELEGTDDDPYEEKQYKVLVDVIALLIETYDNLSTQQIVGHADIAPQRKTDPGPAFDWDLFRNLLKDAMKAG